MKGHTRTLELAKNTLTKTQGMSNLKFRVKEMRIPPLITLATKLTVTITGTPRTSDAVSGRAS